MRKIAFVLLPTLTLLSFVATAANDIEQKLVIQAIPSSEGTVVVKGKPMYEKTFNLTVINKDKSPVELIGHNGCYKAFDTQGKGFELRMTDSELLGKLLSNEAKSGEASFVSDTDAVYNATFVKWTTDCKDQER
ncbi:DUF4354 family protein [unidentified bacterial endosymbiont]|uniref:DUF4354 family protein n=1 Tax=unidentified bacterial endosymbiont TaxID=2355 RepID=UPI00209EF603|nr:DUF4354 family protein [unidentified bacterial endosymbiont]